MKNLNFIERVYFRLTNISYFKIKKQKNDVIILL